MFTAVDIIFLNFAQKPRRDGSNEYPQSMFEQKYEKKKTYQIFFYLKNFHFFVGEIFYKFE